MISPAFISLKVSTEVVDSGIVISNRVSSLRIAEAQISYTGKGTLADANRPGWFTTLFTRFLNPF